MQRCMYMTADTYIHTHTHVHIYIHIHTHVHTYIHIHTHVHQGWGQVQYLYLSIYLSVLDVLEYLVYGNVKVLVLVLDQKVGPTWYLASNFQVLFIKK